VCLSLGACDAEVEIVEADADVAPAVDGGVGQDATVAIDAGSPLTPIDAGARTEADDAGATDAGGNAAADAGVLPIPDAGPRDTIMIDDGFEGFALERWLDGSARAPWRSLYDGHGGTWIERDGTLVLSQSPWASTVLDETHASLVIGDREVSGDVRIEVNMRTVAQLRTPVPNAWEVAWVLWHYTDEGHFYYFVPKPNGWELGKVDNSRVDPSGPECHWPEYLNCRYPGAQRFLATGASPTFPVGPWYSVSVKQRGGVITIMVDDVEVVVFNDEDNAYSTGAVGLYNEDAHVHFDRVRLTSLAPE
jgi:hypothetical protein